MAALRTSAILLALGLAVSSAACGPDTATPGRATPSASAPAAAPSSTSTSTSPTRESPRTPNRVDRLLPREALAAVRAAFLEAPTVHVRGSVVDAGSTLRLDHRLSRNGDADATFSGDDGTLHVVVIGEFVWASGDGDFWTANAGSQASAGLEGRFLRFRRGSPDAARTAQLADRGFLADGILPAEWRPDGRERVDGVDAHRFKDGNGSTYFVASTGEPYLLRLTDGAASDLRFLEYGKPLALKPPPSSQVIVSE